MNTEVNTQAPDYLRRAVERAVGHEPSLRPRLPALFEPTGASGWSRLGELAGERAASDEMPSPRTMHAVGPERAGEWHAISDRTTTARDGDLLPAAAHVVDRNAAWQTGPTDREPSVATMAETDVSSESPRGSGPSTPAPVVVEAPRRRPRDEPAWPVPPREAPPVLVRDTHVDGIRAVVRERSVPRPAVTPPPNASVPLAIRPAPLRPLPVNRDLRTELRGGEPVVHVTIGRVEVRATRDDAPRQVKRGTQGPQPMTLDEYLRRREKSAP